MTATSRTLDELRTEINAIDLQLHELIRRRGALADEIAAIKRRDGIEAVRPGREAMILRRLVERHEGHFSPGALLRIWREMIASITRMEMASYSVAVYAAGEDQGYWDLARDQFGSRTPMTAYGSPREVIAQVFEGAATLGVIPYPTEDDPGTWWPNLCVPDAPRIVYRLPFFGRGNARGGASDGPDALAIGRLTPEATGDDRTALVLETAGGLSRTALTDIMTAANLKPILLASRGAGARLHYAEVEGFVEPSDVRLRILDARDAVERISLIGAYATPMRDPDIAVAGDKP